MFKLSRDGLRGAGPWGIVDVGRPVVIRGGCTTDGGDQESGGHGAGTWGEADEGVPVGESVGSTVGGAMGGNRRPTGEDCSSIRILLLQGIPLGPRPANGWLLGRGSLNGVVPGPNL